MADSSILQAISAYKNATKAADTFRERVETKPLAQSPQEAGRPSFTELLGTSLDKARDAGYSSESISAKAIANEAELHELITSVNNAEMTLNTVVAIRDRVINAYQDIIKMPI